MDETHQPPPPAPAGNHSAVIRGSIGDATCTICNRHFRCRNLDAPDGNPQPAPSHCGSPYCSAVADWTPEEWALQARLAERRQAIGVPLGDLDRYALTNSRPAGDWWDTKVTVGRGAAA